MTNIKILFPLFILLALVQLFVPAKMILDREDILKTGKEFKFRTAPIDPNDPFRGKYITLSFSNTTFDVQDGDEWNRDEDVYVLLKEDIEGFAIIKSVSKDKPSEKQDFVKAKIRNGGWKFNFNNNITIDYPFDRYYMEESKAYDAELAYRDAQINEDNITYALVSIKDGDAVLKDVFINDVSIKEIVKAKQEEDK